MLIILMLVTFCPFIFHVPMCTFSTPWVSKLSSIPALSVFHVMSYVGSTPPLRIQCVCSGGRGAGRGVCAVGMGLI